MGRLVLEFPFVFLYKTINVSFSTTGMEHFHMSAVNLSRIKLLEVNYSSWIMMTKSVSALVFFMENTLSPEQNSILASKTLRSHSFGSTELSCRGADLSTVLKS